MAIRIMEETMSVNIEKPTERMSGEKMSDAHVFVQVKNMSTKSVTLKKEDVTYALKDSKGKLLVATQPESINGDWEGVTLKEDSSKILKLDFNLSEKIVGKIKKGVGSQVLELLSDSIEISEDIDI